MTKIWGPPTWLFLHTFIEKMNEKFYKNNIIKVIGLIKNVCHNLPCSYCDIHSRSYLKHLTPKAVPTKTHMKQFLFKFHNDVNKRIHKPQFTNFEQYKRAKLENIFQNFNNHYPHTSALSKRFISGITRKRIVKKIRTFLLDNSRHFKW